MSLLDPPASRRSAPRFIDYTPLRPGRLISAYIPYDISDAATAAHDPSIDERTRPASATAFEPALTEVVDELLDVWSGAALHQSSMRQAAKHPSFALITKVADFAIDRIVVRMRHQPTAHWVWALSTLAHDDPAGGASTIEEATDAWLEWAKLRDVA